MNKKTELFLDNMFEADAKEFEQRKKGHILKGKLSEFEYPFKEGKDVEGKIVSVHYNKQIDGLAYIIESDDGIQHLASQFCVYEII